MIPRPSATEIDVTVVPNSLFIIVGAPIDDESSSD